MLCPASNPITVFLSPEVIEFNALIPTPVLFVAAFKVPVVAWPTNKEFVKFVPAIFKKSPVGELITGEVKVFIDEENVISLSGVGNYGLKPTELDLKKNTAGGNNDVFITSDVNVDTFSVALECHKETGFTNGWYSNKTNNSRYIWS